MATSYIIRDKTGKQLDRIQANSREESIKLYKAKKTNIPAKGVDTSATWGGKILDAATHEYLPEKDFKTGFGNIVDKPLNFAYEYGARPFSSPIGLATAPFAALKAGPIAVKAAIKGAMAPGNVVKSGAKATGLKGAFRRITEETKQLALTTGFPGTNISTHGVSLAATKALATPWKEGGLPMGMFRAARDLVSQEHVAKELKVLANKPFKVMGQQRYKTVRDPITGRWKRGVPMTLEDAARRYGVTMETTTAGGRMTEPLLTAGKYNPGRIVRNIQEEVFDKPLFEGMAKKNKLEVFERNVADLESKLNVAGLSKRDATKLWAKKVGLQAAKDTGHFFGGLGRFAKWDKSGIANMLLAPDWYERHIRLGKMVAGSLRPKNWKDPAYKAYRTIAGNTVLAMAGIDAANRALSGHSMWENAPGKNFLIDTGRIDSTGGRVYVDPSSGGLDWARLPLDVAHAMTKGKNMGAALEVIQNRLSTTVRAAAEMSGATPYKPSAFRLQFTKKERQPGGGIKFVRRPPVAKQLEFVVEDIIDNMTPGSFQALEDKFHGGERDRPQSKIAALAQAFELPLKVAKDPRPDVLTRAEAMEIARTAAKDRRKKQQEARRKAAAKKKEGGS